MGGARNKHGIDEKSIQYVGWKTEGKLPLESPRRRSEVDIRM